MGQRPAGITLLALAYLALGLISLLWGGMVLGISSLNILFSSLFGAENIPPAEASSAWTGFVFLFSAFVQIVVALGLLNLNRWAWVLALAGVGLTVIQGVIGIINGGLFGLICGGISLVIPVIILVYLLTARVRRAFGV